MGPADAVRLATFMPRFPKGIPFTRLDDSTWVLGLRLPHSARIEYLIEIERKNRLTRVLDPLNPDTAANPFGENSVAVGPAYAPPGWVAESPPVTGRVAEIRVQSRVLGGRRHHGLYSPPGTTSGTPLPLLIVHDGSDYRQFAGLCHILDVLVCRGRIRPLRAALLDPRERHREYVADPRHAAHVVEEVIPHLERRVSLSKPLGVMGASLGAVASWHAAHRYPATFGRILLQSGTFSFGKHPELSKEMHESISAFVAEAVHDCRLGSAKVFQTCGRYESLGEWNRKVHTALAGAGIDCVYTESWAGHDWGAWRDHLEAALTHLYPPVGGDRL